MTFIVCNIFPLNACSISDSPELCDDYVICNDNVQSDEEDWGTHGRCDLTHELAILTLYL